MSERTRFLMCPPEFFDVNYVINPWMEGNLHKPAHDTARTQWQALVDAISEHADVELIQPQEGWPDMVFTANAGLAIGNKFVLSRFLHRERQGEEPHFKKWFNAHGFEVHELPVDLPFEGAGDAYLDKAGGWVWAGYGSRSDLDSHPFIARFFDIEVLSVRLTDPRFYHLDTCLCALNDGYLLYYPQAFDGPSNRLIEQRVPSDKRIAVSEPDAVHFACNAVNTGHHLFLNRASTDLKDRLSAVGFSVTETPLTEFMKSGGAARCLTLQLTEPAPAHTQALSTVQSKTINLEGHLLDSSILERALDITVHNGGSFQVLNFDLGRQRQSISKAEVRVAAPSQIALDRIVTLVIDLGATAPADQEGDADIQPVTQSGVAPNDFYCSTIFATEIRIAGEWVRVQKQRMDAVVVVATNNTESTARCTLMRNLRPGDHVVVGTDGIRTVRKTEGRDGRSRSPSEKEFSFMAGDVSSERRVELIVEQIAWEMHQIRDRGGRIAVVAGPVVIHTGGADHLQWLISAGYVQALLGGNAIAVHDIEQSLFGTSLGLELASGSPVTGGHQHHLRAINAIRNSGSIANAVVQGVLTSGVMHACIKYNVPFSLAGSIRDDGPLPDTHMDLIKAQEEYAQLIEGADMILMLSSMLHSIGVGNMTPAGVKLVCVDINPAVVTKLSDRGSLESFGVVTDVGLFLNLLTQWLSRREDHTQVINQSHGA